MRTQKQISSQIVKLSTTISKLNNSLYKMEYNGKDTSSVLSKIKDREKLMKTYCAMITEEGYNSNPIIEETLCCDWEEFADCYVN